MSHPKKMTASELAKLVVDSLAVRRQEEENGLLHRDGGPVLWLTNILNTWTKEQKDKAEPELSEEPERLKRILLKGHELLKLGQL